MGRGDYRNYYKGHMDKTKGESGSKEGRWVCLAGVGGGAGGGGECRQMQTTVIE